MKDRPIPPSQDRPPATFDHLSRYLPSCQQMQSHHWRDRVEWGIQLNGTFHKMRELPQMPEIQAFSSLNDAGLCKLHGVEVPIVPPSQAIASTRQIVDNVPMQASSSIPPIAIVGGLAALAIAIGAIALNRKDADFQAFIGGEKE